VHGTLGGRPWKAVPREPEGRQRNDEVAGTTRASRRLTPRRADTTEMKKGHTMGNKKTVAKRSAAQASYFLGVRAEADMA